MAKITIGFKCDPNMKNELLREASEYGISLSEYVENICANRWTTRDDDKVDTSDAEILAEQVEELSTALQEYQNLLQPLFERHRGETHNMKLPDGRVVQIEITHPIDVLEIVLASVKTRP
jgi:hypothetical protein